MTDPENGDFRPLPGSPAEGYGCQTFPGKSRPRRAAGAACRRPRDRTARRSARTVEVSGAIEEDTLWDADTVRVVGDVTIEDAITLSITPGAQVRFADHYGLFVLGRLLAIGTSESPIRMTSDHPELFAVDSTTAGAWFGIRFEHTSSRNDSSRLEYCLIERCKAAGDGSRGGALSVVGFSKLRVANCVFRMNVADYGAVAYCAGYAAPDITGCVFEHNHAFVGGSVVFCVDAFPELVNDTIVDNHVLNEEIFYATGTLHNHMSKSRLANSILWSNSSNYYLGGEIREGKPYYVVYSDVEGGHDGQGNLDAPPEFSGSGAHPYALSETSPCINAGTPDLADIWLPPADLAGNPRVRMGRVDIGAYEWQPITGVAEAVFVPARWTLRSTPNPFALSTTISFTLGVRAVVRADIFDARGRRVRTLLDAIADPGERAVVWDGRDETGSPVASGTYLCRIRSAGLEAHRRVQLLR